MLMPTHPRWRVGLLWAIVSTVRIGGGGVVSSLAARRTWYHTHGRSHSSASEGTQRRAKKKTLIANS